MDNKKPRKKLGDMIKDNLQKITIFIVSLIYIAQGVFTIVKKDTTIWNIVGSVGLSITVGIVISNSLYSMGLTDGRKSNKFIDSLKGYGEAKNKATPYFDKLSSWCEYKNSQDLESKKKDIIQSAGLNWKAYKIGFYTKHKEKLDKKQEVAIIEADKCTIQKLSSRELLSDIPNNHNKVIATGSKFGSSEKDYKRKNVASDLISKLAMSIICGLYTLSPLINQENMQEVMANILWNSMQIAMWLTFGVLKYANAKSFIEEEYRQTHIIQKTEYLNEFIITMQNNPSVINEFDEDKELDKYLKELEEERKEIKSKEKELVANE